MSDTIHIQGLVGNIEILVDYPENEAKAFAVVCHPHPLQGGTPQHKVPTLLTKIFTQNDCIVYRPYFRGLGQTAGLHDDGFGETDDILTLISHLQTLHPQLPFYAAGFSFGAHVLAKCFVQLDEKNKPKQMILCGLPTAKVRGIREYQTPFLQGDLLFIHGENDEITQLSDVLNWARPQKHLITVLPGANHFFTGYLKQLHHAIERFLSIK
ncbi:alpha/beta hydrolase [Acinetobacter sichuanensis]|uniref:Hydrolase n=1 Tax=Acinetobacter sichuanensis TaxID=2136183 RepID=A0A371YSQ5_9GAMM|nr:hydrolase [Acinetobacter sichuanensis]RFC84404.1 hydrolase [Acinetobacter sichuanensis]